MQIDKENITLLNDNGSTLIAAIVAIVVLGLLGVGIQQMSSSAVFNQLIYNQANQARNLAHAGKNYLLGLKNKATIDNLTLDASKTTINNNLTKTIPGAGSFEIYNLVWNGATLTCSIKGTTENGQASYLLPNSVSVVFPNPVTEWSGGDYIINSGEIIVASQQSTINGNISGKSVKLDQKVELSGNIVSNTSVSISQNSEIGGLVCANSGDVTIDQNAIILGNVSAKGNIKISQKAQLKKNAYAELKINMDQNSSIALTGQAGDAITKAQGATIGNEVQYLTPTITCPVAYAPYAPTIKSTGTINPPTNTSATSPMTPGQYTALTLPQNSKVYLKSGTYTFPSMSFDQNLKLYLDISSGNDLTILSSGSIKFSQGTVVYVKTPGSSSYEEISSVTPHSAASKIYIGSDTSIQFDQKDGWFGTIYGKQSVRISQNFSMVGAIASPGSVTVDQNLNLIQYVLANYAQVNWRPTPY